MDKTINEERPTETVKERTPDQWDNVIAELKRRIKKLEEDMAYQMAKK